MARYIALLSSTFLLLVSFEQQLKKSKSFVEEEKGPAGVLASQSRIPYESDSE